MESVRGEDCQDPIPAMLTLNLAEMQGRDHPDPVQGVGGRQAAAGTTWSALELRGQPPAWLPKANWDECPELCHQSLSTCLHDACRKKVCGAC